MSDFTSDKNSIQFKKERIERMRKNAHRRRDSLYDRVLWTFGGTKNLVIVVSATAVVLSVAVYNYYYGDDRPVKMPDFGI